MPRAEATRPRPASPANASGAARPMVELHGVTKQYAHSAAAVDNLDLRVERGELVVLIGPSGCGKTTTLRMINRMIEPTSGDILLDGRDVRQYDPVQLRRGIGYVIQQVGLFPHMTIAENIEVVPRLLRWAPDRRHERTAELLHMVGMEPAAYAHRYPHELSGGQQQRIGVLRALAADPELVLMDEPFGALDPITREQLQGELKHLQQTVRKTIVFVTHDMDEALRLADRIAILRQGKLLQYDTPTQILRSPANEFIADFVGRHRISDSQLPRQVRDVMNKRPVMLRESASVEEGFALMESRQVDTMLVVDDADRLRGYVSARRAAEPGSRGKTLGEICRSDDLGTAAPDEDAISVFNRMDSNRNAYVAVVDGGEHLVGIVTHRSMLRALAAAVWGEDN